jgi:CO dehydrogenase nickel-insertion accessory protein CooC1
MSGPAANFARLLDMKGKEVLRIDSDSNFELPQNLVPGTYVLQIHSTQLISNHSLIIVE